MCMNVHTSTYGLPVDARPALKMFSNNLDSSRLHAAHTRTSDVRGHQRASYIRGQDSNKDSASRLPIPLTKEYLSALPRNSIAEYLGVPRSLPSANIMNQPQHGTG